MPWDPPVRAGRYGQGKGNLGSPAETAASTTQPRISGWMDPWMDGWMDGWIDVLSMSTTVELV